MGVSPKAAGDSKLETGDRRQDLTMKNGVGATLCGCPAPVKGKQ